MANDIHSTAIIDPGAELGDGIVVGPYCVIGAGVKLGDGSRLHNHVTLAGPSEIGANNEFYPYASIGQRSQDLKYAGEPTFLKIGDGNTFREFCTVNRGTAPGSYTVVGSHGNYLAYSHIAHDCIVGDHVIFSNNGTLAGHVTVGDHAIMGGLTAVHQFCRIGAHAITGGCSKIVQDVLKTLGRLKAEGISSLVVEQNALAALGVADRVYVMDRGKIVHEGAARELLDTPGLRRRLLGV